MYLRMASFDLSSAIKIFTKVGRLGMALHIFNLGLLRYSTGTRIFSAVRLIDDFAATLQQKVKSIRAALQARYVSQIPTVSTYPYNSEILSRVDPSHICKVCFLIDLVFTAACQAVFGQKRPQQ